jgi:hypothetical protein
MATTQTTISPATTTIAVRDMTAFPRSDQGRVSALAGIGLIDLAGLADFAA